MEDVIRALSRFGVAAAVSLASLVPMTASGDVDATYHPRRRVAHLVNYRRVEAGLPRLRLHFAVHTAAQKHSRYQARMNWMTHTGSGGSSAGDRITREGYTWSAWGENVAMGYPRPRAVVRAWMQSSGHRANILSGSFRHVGVGMRRAADGTPYWTLDFARPG